MAQSWFDAAAGPVVRPYAMTRGRTRAAGGSDRIDLIAMVIPEATAHGGTPEREPPRGELPDGEPPRSDPPPSDLPSGAGRTRPDDDHTLAPEHLEIVRRCRRAPLSVADLAGELDLPVGVVRVLVGDLIDAGLVRVTRPVPPADLPDEHILREVIHGLRAL
ncbi:DUF742 domain-containing protein [Streptomyces oceani]|uniref:Multi-component regulatory system-11 n=1 Tax=Streptomyces oceani TaxID=1075402 RepID=A0A1E7JXQ9_9ACTN|nr:DUF742 domain-containing protein [Streptomyces oceani]OEU96449.1 hypothetical protein AN216_20370 [Streptomyces oceani]